MNSFRTYVLNLRKQGNLTVELLLILFCLLVTPLFISSTLSTVAWNFYILSLMLLVVVFRWKGYILGVLLISLIQGTYCLFQGYVDVKSICSPDKIYFLALSGIMVFLVDRLIDSVGEVKNLKEQVGLLAKYDEYTGLINLGTFMGCLSLEIRRAERQNTGLTLVLIESDILSIVVEKIGVKNVSKYLGLLGSMLSQSIREIDVAGRLTFDTYGVILIDSNPETVCQIVERIKKPFDYLAKEILSLKESPPIRVGTATFGEDGYSSSELVHTAEEALKEGRVNRQLALEEKMQMSEKYAVIGQLSAGLAHEIKNPLTSVRGFIQLLHIKHKEVFDKECMDLIISELDRINNLVKEFMQLAKPNEPKRTNIDLVEILNSIVVFMSGDAVLHDVQIVTEIPSSSVEMFGDPHQIKQVIINLLHNSIEAMPDGGKLYIKLKEKQKSIFLSVKDSGIGISPEYVEKIFDPFHTTKPEGTGLGLAIVKSIVENHHGNIQVESEKGQGTTINITFQK